MYANSQDQETVMHQQDLNIKYDFSTVGNTQELSIMPSWLAEVLLRQLAMQKVSAATIVGTLLDDIRGVINNENAVQDAMDIALKFVQTRELIDNIKNENWDAYVVK